MELVAVAFAVIGCVFGIGCVVVAFIQEVRAQPKVEPHVEDTTPPHQIGVDISAMTKTPVTNIGIKPTTHATQGAVYLGGSGSGSYIQLGTGTVTTSFPVTPGMWHHMTGTSLHTGHPNDEYEVPERNDDEPIGAFKAAALRWEPGGLVLRPCNWTTYLHERVAKARCTRTPGPHLLDACTCGFYALKSRDAAVRYGHGVLLEVELSGRVLVCEYGYRAACQRIISVIMPGRCFVCGEPSDTLTYERATNELTARCPEHADTFKPDLSWKAPTVCDVPITFDATEPTIYGWSQFNGS